MTVTRLEIAEHIADSFAYPPTSRAELLAAAVASHARAEVIETLELLPERSYNDLRSLWPHLEGVPVDA